MKDHAIEAMVAMFRRQQPEQRTTVLNRMIDAGWVLSDEDDLTSALDTSARLVTALRLEQIWPKGCR